MFLLCKNRSLLAVYVSFQLYLYLHFHPLTILVFTCTCPYRCRCRIPFKMLTCSPTTTTNTFCPVFPLSVLSPSSVLQPTGWPSAGGSPPYEPSLAQGFFPERSYSLQLFGLKVFLPQEDFFLT